MKTKSLFIAAVVMCLSLALSGCADIAKTTTGDAISVVQLEPYLNNARASGFGAFCIPEFRMAGNSELLHPTSANKEFIVFKSPPGKVQMTSIFCMQYAVLYNKQRQHIFKEPISFYAEAGHVNYAGKLKVNYRMSSFNAADLFGVPETESQGFKVNMKLLDDYPQAQQEFLKEYKALPPGFAFRKSLFNGNSQFD